MEISDLRYFLAVCETENVNKASEILKISPGAVSKAIKRLEDELDVPLFRRDRKRIFINDNGLTLKIRAQQIIDLEMAAKSQLSPQHKIQIRVAGEESLLSLYVEKLVDRVTSRYPEASFDIRTLNQKQIFTALRNGEIHLGLSSVDGDEFESQEFAKEEFSVFAGKNHNLGQLKKTIKVEELITHSFVIPRQSIYGENWTHLAADGWRDDHFPRKILGKVESLMALSQLVLSGQALAYLPTSLGLKLGFNKIKVSGCPYSCESNCYLLSFQPQRIGWLHQLF